MATVRFLKRLLLIIAVVVVMSLKPVTDRLPEPMKGAFSNLRQTAIQVASGDGVSMPHLSNMRGLWELGSAGGVEHVGGR